MSARRLTAKVLSAKSGISRPTISKILHEHQDAEDETLKALAKALDWPLPGWSRSGDGAVMAALKIPGPTLSGISQVVATEIARVIEQVIRYNELGETAEGRAVIAEATERWAARVNRLTGADVSRVLLALRRLRRK